MPATKKEKDQAIAELKESFSNAKVIVFTEYRGLNVKSLSALRRKMREAGGRLIVSKNTIATLAARETGLEGLEPFLTGPTALAFGFDDLVSVPKLITQFDKDYKQFQFKGGVVEGTVIGKDDVRNLAELPPREVLLVLNLFLNAPQELLELAFATWRKSGKYRADGDKAVARMLGLPPDAQPMSRTESYFTNSSV